MTEVEPGAGRGNGAEGFERLLGVQDGLVVAHVKTGKPRDAHDQMSADQHQRLQDLVARNVALVLLVPNRLHHQPEERRRSVDSMNLARQRRQRRQAFRQSESEDERA